MAIVCDHHWYFQFLCKLNELRHYLLFFFQTVVLQLNIEVTLAKYAPELVCRLSCFLRFICQKQLRHLSLNTGCQSYQPLMILLQQFAVDPSPIIEAFQITARNELHQVSVASLVFCQQNQMIRGLL